MVMSEPMKVPCPSFADVDDRAVLNVGPLADAHDVDIGTNDAAEPDAGVVADLDVTNHCCARRKEDAGADLGVDAPVGQHGNGHDGDPSVAVISAASSEERH